MRTEKTRAARSSKARPLVARKAGPVVKPTRNTMKEVRDGLVDTLWGPDPKTGMQLASDLHNLECTDPKFYQAAVRMIADAGYLLSGVLAEGSPTAQYLARTVMAYRRQIIRDLEIGSTAEYMLLDAAMDAYVHWLEMSALVRLSFKDGTTDLKAKTQARLAGMAQNYLRTYMDAMKALTDLKQPPIRVLHVQAGQTVAVQINEQPAGAKAGRPPKELPHVERRNLLESAPADATPAAEDHD